MAIDWSTRVNTRLKKSWSRLSGCVCSASMQMRSIAWTTSTGYLPLAVSAESITASVPSSTAFATSDTSARVGTGLEIIDSIIWVAVMVSLLCSRPSRIIFFCSAGTAASPTSTARSPHAAVAHDRVHLAAFDGSDLEHDLAVVEQQHRAGLDVARQLLVIEAGPVAVAQLAGRVEDEALPLLERDLAVLEPADADLRPLQVAHDGHRAAGLRGDALHQRGALLVVRRAAVREVEPHHVHAGADHALEHHGVAGSRAEGGHDLGAAGHSGNLNQSGCDVQLLSAA